MRHLNLYDKDQNNEQINTVYSMFFWYFFRDISLLPLNLCKLYRY